MSGTRRKTDAPREDLAASSAASSGSSDEDLLNSSPFDGDLSEELAAEPRPRRRPPSVTLLLGAAVLIVGGFVGGVQADRHWGAKQSPTAASFLNQLASRRTGQGGGGGGGGFGGFGGQFPGAGGFGQRGGNGGAGGAGGGTTGTVKLVDGDTIYVQTANGIVRVKTSKSTKVTIAKKSTAKALKTGSTVVVQGTPGQDGTVTATSVQGG